MQYKLRWLILIVCTLTIFAGIGVFVGSLVGKNWQLQTELNALRLRPTPTVAVTATSKPTIKTVNHTVTRTVYRDGYVHIGDDPAWTCAGNWFHVYMSNELAYPATQGGPEQVWMTLCPNVPMPN